MSPRHGQDAGLRVTLRRCRYTEKGVLIKPMDFQVAPVDEFGWDASYAWTDYDTISAGQFSRRGGRQLRTLNITTLAVDWSAPWAVIQTGRRERPRNDDDYYGRAGGPWKVAKRLDRLVVRGSPILLIVRNPALYKQPDVQMIVTLRSASIRERAGEPDARYFDLSFTEYRLPKVARRKYGERSELPAQVFLTREGIAIENKRRGKSLDDGDTGKIPRHQIGTKKSPATLRKLAKHYYGTPSEWKRIARANDIARDISGDESLVKVYRRRRGKGLVLLNIPTRKHKSKSGGLTIPNG